MQFPESWLREFCNPAIDSTALAELLTMSGMEVEDARPAAPPFTGVVVGAGGGAPPPPTPSRRRGGGGPAGRGAPPPCGGGAPNVRAGLKVPCALVGAALPPPDDTQAGAKPFVIKLGQLRGVESQGMLCSARELKL